ncbi:hypothetical protein ACSBR2_039788 [Camellia fascicularis]
MTSMAKPDEEKCDGLEIISIGTLYSGLWDKKYWSSSRGKDRYPYPVGYKAVRTHNGNTYKMEICEGLKGPLFSITYTDGESCSGHTPDIAWKNFQKKGCPHIKLWHGKRFSCKIDGVEFFGFKNPFVQRLLRELVANVGGTAEQSFSSPRFGNGDSGTKNHTQCKESCTYLARTPQIKGKRSRKQKTINFKTFEGSLKKLRPKDQMHNNDISDSRQGTHCYLNGGTSMTYFALNEEFNVCNNSGALAASINLETVVEGENNPFIAKDGLPLESSHSDHLKEEVTPHKESNLVSSENCISAGIAGNLSIHDPSLDRSKHAEMQRFYSSMASEDKDGEASISTDTQNVNDMDLYAPDTLDLLQDSTLDSQRDSLKEIPCNGKCELIARNVAVSEVPAPDLHPQEEMGTLNASSEKSDFDSVGQEITNSMMTVLLPRALPLLKTFSRKQKKIMNPSEISPCREQSQKENNKTDHHVDVASSEVHTQSPLLDQQDNEKMHILKTDPGSVVPSSGQNAPVDPDNSVNSDQSGPDVAEAGLTTVGERKTRSDTLGLPVGVDASVQPSICQVGSGDNKNICSYNKGPVALIACNEDICGHSDEKFMLLEIHSKEKDHNTSPNYTEGTIDDNSTTMASFIQSSDKEISLNNRVAGAGNTSFTQIQNKATSTRKHNGPLTESIIFRSFTDGDAPASDTHTATNFFLASEIQSASSSNHRPHKSVSSGIDARLERWPHSLHPQKNTKIANGVLPNVVTVLPQNQAFICPSNINYNLDSLDPSASCIGKSNALVDEDLQRNQNLVDISNSVSWLQKQGTSFCVNHGEVADDSSLKPLMNMGHIDKPERIVEFVGCYVHPLPISFVLLSKIENEIYLCVLCGILVDKSRILFMYKVSLQEQRVGCPSFIGHTPILLPTSRDAFGREIALDRSGLQVTPDGQCLVLLESVKAPYCREGKMQCPCSACRSDCLKSNVVKVVQVKHGYVSVVVKLKAVDNVHCILVCEPNCLIGIEESGRLHLWVMNSTWSAQVEECDLSTSDCIFPCIVELKRIPNCSALVVGHNGFGEFSLWDISKRTFIARFSSPSNSVFQFLPISLVRWQSEGHGDPINNIIAATKTSLLEQGENHVSIPIEGEDVAIWIFVSTVCNSDVQHDLESSNHKINPVGFWRLALLAKNRVILGSALDPSAAAIGASSYVGIIGTCDGLVYMWELSSGTKLRDLHCFKDAGVSCIAIDDSRSGPLGVAAGDQLMVYLPSQGGIF